MTGMENSEKRTFKDIKEEDYDCYIEYLYAVYDQLEKDIEKTADEDIQRNSTC